jgi:hypothetical protein
MPTPVRLSSTCAPGVGQIYTDILLLLTEERDLNGIIYLTIAAKFALHS